MDKKIEFIYDSIHDIQSTIRAVDTKVATLLIVISIPIANIGEIADYLENFLSKRCDVFGWTLVAVFAHVANSEQLKGVYYGSDLYKINILDIFFNRDVLKTSKSVDIYYEDFPGENIDIAKELIFEQMKLTYIRDIKIYRFNFSIRATYFWFTFGFIIYFISRYM